MGTSVEIDGLKELVKKTTPKFLEKPLAWLLEGTAIEYLSRGKRRAAVDTGRMRASLNRGYPNNLFAVDASKPPLWARVGTDVSHLGFPYPKALDESGRYHYRGGGALGKAAAGQPTKGWFSGVKEEIRDWFLKRVRETERKIRQAWEKG